MRIRPDGVELLQVARTVIDAAIVPNLADDRRGALGAIERALTLAEDRLVRDVDASADDLAALEDARVAMRGPVLEALPEQRRYDARLVAKAISVATRQLANGHAAERRECERLAALLDAPSAARASLSEIRCALPSLNERLGTRIRAGDADLGTTNYAATLAHLEANTQEALSESNPTYRRRAGNPEPSITRATPWDALAVTPVAALFSVWSAVPRAVIRGFQIAAGPAPLARRLDAYLHLRSVLGEAVYASGSAALAAQTDLFGCLTQRLAANPRVPMAAVEAAHQTHDLAIAMADASAAMLRLALWPFLRVEPRRSDATRLP